MMIQLSQTQERNFYLDFSATDYELSLYQFTFTSMSTGSDSNFLLTPVSKTGRAYKFLFNLSSSESLFAGQYIVRVLHDHFNNDNAERRWTYHYRVVWDTGDESTERDECMLDRELIEDYWA